MPRRIDVLRGVPDARVEERVRILRRDPRVVAIEVEPDGPGTSKITVTMEIPAVRALAKRSPAAATKPARAKAKKAAKATPARAKPRTSAKPRKVSPAAKIATARATPRKPK